MVLRGLAIVQQGGQLRVRSGCQGLARGGQVQVTARNARNTRHDGLQERQQLLGTKIAQGIDATGGGVKCGNLESGFGVRVQGHGKP